MAIVFNPGTIRGDTMIGGTIYIDGVLAAENISAHKNPDGSWEVDSMHTVNSHGLKYTKMKRTVVKSKKLPK